jgi:hypothetical protein
LYGYADGDPINKSDPFGLSAQKDDGDTAAADTTEKEKSDEGFLACVQRMASANVENFDETVAGWFGSTSTAAGRAAQFGGGVLARQGMSAAGYGTSSNGSLLGRWLLNKSAVPPMRPLLVQGIRVGATSAGALTTTALAAGVATNAAAGAAVYYGFRGGVRLGSYVVGMNLCSGK